MDVALVCTILQMFGIYQSLCFVRDPCNLCKSSCRPEVVHAVFCGKGSQGSKRKFLITSPFSKLLLARARLNWEQSQLMRLPMPSIFPFSRVFWRVLQVWCYNNNYYNFFMFSLAVALFD